MSGLTPIFIFCARYLYLFSVLVAVGWFLRLSRSEKVRAAVFGMVVLPASYGIAKIAGVLYYDPRPFVVGYFAPLLSHVADNGFPSDHELLVSAIAAIVFPYHKLVSGILWVFASLVGVSRVMVGIHHPIDIVGSAVISILVSATAYFFLKKTLWR